MGFRVRVSVRVRVRVRKLETAVAFSGATLVHERKPLQ